MLAIRDHDGTVIAAAFDLRKCIEMAGLNLGWEYPAMETPDGAEGFEFQLVEVPGAWTFQEDMIKKMVYDVTEGERRDIWLSADRSKARRSSTKIEGNLLADGLEIVSDDGIKVHTWFNEMTGRMVVTASRETCRCDHDD